MPFPVPCILSIDHRSRLSGRARTICVGGNRHAHAHWRNRTGLADHIRGNDGKCAKLPATITLRCLHYVLLIRRDCTTVFICCTHQSCSLIVSAMYHRKFQEKLILLLIKGTRKMIF